MNKNFIAKGITFAICLIVIIALFSISTIKSEAASAEVMNGIKDFQRYINSNLPSQYLGTSLVVDGYAGDLTKAAAVKLLQYKLNSTYGTELEVDGNFGQALQNAYYNSIEKIRRFDLEEFVYILQGLLYCHEYNPVGFDGSYGTGGGTGCLNAVNQYKADNAITEFPDTYYGAVGVQTIASLCWKSYKIPNYTLSYANGNIITGCTKYPKAPPNLLNVNWSSADTSIATVNNSGDVIGIKAGKTSIYAYCTDTLTGNQYTINSIIYVTISDGVYYIKNYYSDLYLHTQNGGIANLTNVYQYTKNTSSSTSQLRQFWKIHYLGDGYYSIRPMHKLDMGLDVTGTNVDIYNIGTTDTIAGVPSYAKWTIEKVASTGYTFKKNGLQSQTLSLETYTKTTGANVNVQENYVYSRQVWELEAVIPPPEGVLLYDTSNETIVTNPTKHIAPGETLNYNQLKLAAVSYSGNTISQTFTWFSQYPEIVKVDPTYGYIIAVSPGTSVITGKRYMNGILYEVKYTVKVAAIPNGECFIKNRQYNLFMQIDNDAGPEYSTSGSIMEQFNFDGGDYQKWIVTLLEDGYYKIISKKSGLALSVQSGQVYSEDKPVVQEAYNGLSRQQWKIEMTSHGSYKITARSAINHTPELALVAGVPFLGIEEGTNIEQRKYIDNTSYKDEWYIYESDDASLIAIPVGYDRSSYFPDIQDNLANIWYSDVFISDSDMGSQEILARMATSKITLIRTHGNKTSIETSGANITAYDMVLDYQSTAFDYSKLIVYGACLTGEGREGAFNLVNTTLDRGADIVIGFDISVYAHEMNYWAEEFFEALTAGGNTVYEAGVIASHNSRDKFGNNVTTQNPYIAGDKNFRFW